MNTEHEYKNLHRPDTNGQWLLNFNFSNNEKRTDLKHSYLNYKAQEQRQPFGKVMCQYLPVPSSLGSHSSK